MGVGGNEILPLDLPEREVKRVTDQSTFCRETWEAGESFYGNLLFAICISVPHRFIILYNNIYHTVVLVLVLALLVYIIFIYTVLVYRGVCKLQEAVGKSRQSRQSNSKNISKIEKVARAS